MLSLFRLNLNKYRKRGQGVAPEGVGSFGEPAKGGFRTIQASTLTGEDKKCQRLTQEIRDWVDAVQDKR